MQEILDSLFPADPDARSEAVAAQVAAARHACGVAGLPHLGMLELSGSDAVRFLHGQCTQDVKGKKPNEGGYAFLLDARGKNLGDFRFVVRESAILCVLDQDRLASTAAWLDRFVIAADVRIVTPPDRAGILVTGPRAKELVASATGAIPPAVEHHAAAAGDLLVIGNRDGGEEGFEVWGPTLLLITATRRLTLAGARPMSPLAVEILRIEAGRPRYGVDLDDTVLPEESGQGARAVSYTKGCYSGQEVVAKQKYLGKPRKLLAGVLPAEVILGPAPLTGADGLEAGHLTSCTFSPTLRRPIGLALLKGPALAPGEILVGPQGVRVEVAALPFAGAISSRA